MLRLRRRVRVGTLGARLNAACGGVSGHATPVNQLSLSSTTQKRFMVNFN